MSQSSKYLKIFAFTYLIFLYAPALLLPIFSFNSSQIIAFPLTGFSTHWFKTLFYQETLHEALKNSLIIAVASSCLGTILGVLQPAPQHDMIFLESKSRLHLSLPHWFYQKSSSGWRC